MLPIYICEDVDIQLKHILSVINNYIMMENLDMEVVCAESDPFKLLDYLCSHPVPSLYFLDIDYKCKDMDGFKLAKQIRKYDPRGFIVMTTAHHEMSMMTFKYRIEAMDYIVKDPATFDAKVLTCLTDAYNLYSNLNNTVQKTVSFKIGGKVISINYDDIYSIQSMSDASHRINIFLKDSTMDIYSTLNEVQEMLDDTFYRCHKSCIVNLSHIMELDNKNYVAKLDNNEICYAAKRTFNEFKKKYMTYTKNN